MIERHGSEYKSLVQFILISFRNYDEPKLPKPKELKGIKQDYTIEFAEKSKCGIFILDKDVYIKHNDYFSPSLKGGYDFDTMPLSSKLNKLGISKKGKKFIYADDWGDIVLKQEAWIMLKGIITDIEKNIHPVCIRHEILRQQEKVHSMERYDLEVGEWERFYSAIIRKLSK